MVELEAAEAFLRCVPSAEMVKFAKNGSDATTAAVKLARAVTGRDLVAVCRDQPFFSVDDWFIGLTEAAAGVPEAVRRLTVTFPFNDLPAAEALFAEHGEHLACVMLEAERDEVPRPGYLAGLRRLCDAHGTLLVIDETISGFRLHVGGAQTLHGVVPDLSTFGKGMANGFSVSALAGRREFMERGGLTTPLEKVFLLSTTHGGETHALAAAIETMDETRERDVPAALAEKGRLLASFVNDAARSAGVSEHFHTEGHPANLIYVTKDAAGRRSQSVPHAVPARNRQARPDRAQPRRGLQPHARRPARRRRPHRRRSGDLPPGAGGRRRAPPRRPPGEAGVPAVQLSFLRIVLNSACTDGCSLAVIRPSRPTR